jgi:hypothetical protein
MQDARVWHIGQKLVRNPRTYCMKNIQEMQRQAVATSGRPFELACATLTEMRFAAAVTLPAAAFNLLIEVVGRMFLKLTPSATAKYVRHGWAELKAAVRIPVTMARPI